MTNPSIYILLKLSWNFILLYVDIIIEGYVNSTSLKDYFCCFQIIYYCRAGNAHFASRQRVLFDRRLIIFYDLAVVDSATHCKPEPSLIWVT